jgi:tRNA nucleotidyltransferase/poly(A) polymerase
MSDPMAKNTPRRRPPSVFAKGDFLEGLSRGECPVCYATQKAARKYIHSFLYEGMMSSIARQDFLDGGGFCHEHFWQAKAIEQECWADGFGVAILCENLLEASLKDLERLKQPKAGLRTRLATIRRAARDREKHCAPEAGCIACKSSRSSERHFLSALEEWLHDDEFAERFNQSSGLCLHHIRAASEQWTSGVAFEAMGHVAKKWIGQLLEELREFQRKHDYRFKNEPRGAEWTSPERSLDFLVGANVLVNNTQELLQVRRPRR